MMASIGRRNIDQYLSILSHSQIQLELYNRTTFEVMTRPLPETQAGRSARCRKLDPLADRIV